MTLHHLRATTQTHIGLSNTRSQDVSYVPRRKLESCAYSSAVSEDERKRFTPIIDSILVAADLETISEKRIRKGLQTAIEYDLTEKKVPTSTQTRCTRLNISQHAVKALIMARFDRAMEPAKEDPKPPKTNGHAIKAESPTPPSTANHETSASPAPSKKHKHEDLSDSVSSVIDSPKPKKKRKIENQDSDAAYAAKLQAMENQRSRSTRGGGAKATKPVKKKTPKKKSSNKIKAEDDSDMDGSGSGGEAKERKVNRNTGFHVSASVLMVEA